MLACLIVYMFLLTNLVKNIKHLLLVLLSLEGLLIIVFMAMIILTEQGNLMFSCLIFFMFVSVCEGCLGLSILVSLVRKVGNDQVGLINLS